MTQNKNQMLLKGAFILAFANVLVKIIGAAFKIPLTYLIDTDGMGLFNISYTTYTFMFVVATAGFPTAISKMVSSSIALGKKRDADRIFTVSILNLAIVGVIGSFVLYHFAKSFANALGSPRAYLGIMAISPAVLCVALVSAFRGYFQGHQNMYPTAVSEVLEALGKLCIGYFLAAFFIQKGVELASAGAIFGVTCGTFLSLLSLLVIYIIRKNKNKFKTCEPVRSYRSIFGELMVTAIPITIGASVASLTNVIDMLTVIRRLQSITQVTNEFATKYQSMIDFSKFHGGIYEKLATSLYGLYSGYAVPLFTMPQMIIVTLAISVVPAIAGALSVNDHKSALKNVNSVIKMTMLFTMPCAIGLAVLAEPILKLIYNNSLGTILLQELAISIIFVSLVSVTSAILQAYGKVYMYIPVLNMTIGGIIKIIINYTMVAIPSVNIQGAPIGTAVCYFSIALMNFIWIRKVTGAKFQFTNFLIKPVVATGIMGVSVKIVYELMIKYHLSMKLSVIPAIALGGAVYVVTVLLIGALKHEDFEMMPKGDKILILLKKLHLTGEKNEA